MHSEYNRAMTRLSSAVVDVVYDEYSVVSVLLTSAVADVYVTTLTSTSRLPSPAWLVSTLNETGRLAGTPSRRKPTPDTCTLPASTTAGSTSVVNGLHTHQHSHTSHHHHGPVDARSRERTFLLINEYEWKEFYLQTSF